MSLADYFTYLYNKWITAKKTWDEKQHQMMNQLKEQYKSPPGKWWDEYIVWYENNADAYITHINAAYNEILAHFPLAEWGDAIALLNTVE